MPERTLEAFELKGPKPRTIGILIILFIILSFFGDPLSLFLQEIEGLSSGGERGESNHGRRAQLQSPCCGKGNQSRCARSAPPIQGD